MDTQTLKQALMALQREIASGGTVDPELTNMVQQLHGAIEARLNQSGGTPHHDADPLGLTARSQELSARFAVQHPHLEPVLRELTDTLQRIGI